MFIFAGVPLESESVAYYYTDIASGSARVSRHAAVWPAFSANM